MSTSLGSCGRCSLAKRLYAVIAYFWTFFGYPMMRWSHHIQLALGPSLKLESTTIWSNDIVGKRSRSLRAVTEKRSYRGLACDAINSMISLNIGKFGVFGLNRACRFVVALGYFLWNLAHSLLTSLVNQGRARKAMSIIHLRVRMTCMMCKSSGSGGGAVAGWIWGHWGWMGVGAAGISILAVQLVWWLLPLKTSGRNA
jgi:hypothetical protein